MLDAIQQRVLGVLVEKERTVPDTYPLTENALLAGCNQKSNRDPEMELDSTEIHPALLALRESGLLARVDTGGRRTRYRHRAEEGLNVNGEELAILTELMLRGPQAPGALERRVARLGLHAGTDRIRELLRGLADRGVRPLVEELPRRARERDNRWGHLLGPRPQIEDSGPAETVSAAPAVAREPEPRPVHAPEPRPELEPAMPMDSGDAEPQPERVEALEGRVARLEIELEELRQRLESALGG